MLLPTLLAARAGSAAGTPLAAGGSAAGAGSAAGTPLAAGAGSAGCWFCLLLVLFIRAAGFVCCWF